MCSINPNFLYVPGNKEKLCDLLYCGNHFIGVTWNQIFNVSEVCLCDIFVFKPLPYFLLIVSFFFPK